MNLAGDFKTTEKKITWLADIPDLVPVVFRKLGYLITKDKFDEYLLPFCFIVFSRIFNIYVPLKLSRNDKFEDYINNESLKDFTGLGDAALRTLNKGDRIQVERKGFYIVDSPFNYPNKPIVLVLIPDGTAATK